MTIIPIGYISDIYVIAPENGRKDERNSEDLRTATSDRPRLTKADGGTISHSSRLEHQGEVGVAGDNKTSRESEKNGGLQADGFSTQTVFLILHCM